MKISEIVETIKKDGNEVKVTVKEEPHNAQEALKHFIKKHQNKVLLLMLVGLVFFSSDYADKYIPNWFYVMVASGLVSAIVTWPYAKRIADWFIEDTRKPVLEIDPKEEQNDIGLIYIPEKKTGDINLVDGEIRKFRSKKHGEGFEFQEIQIDEEGPKTTINAIGTWAGSKSGLELKRDKRNISRMFENLEPLARKGFEYEMQWPRLINELSERIINILVMEFQDVNHKGKEMQQHINQIIGEAKPEKITDETEKTDIEKTLENLRNGNADNGNKEEQELDELAEMQIGGET